jgi:hypothetical protein
MNTSWKRGNLDGNLDTHKLEGWKPGHPQTGISSQSSIFNQIANQIIENLLEFNGRGGVYVNTSWKLSGMAIAGTGLSSIA